MFLGDFNYKTSENSMIEFCKMYKLKNTVKGMTYKKILERPYCINFILINRQRSFQGCPMIEISLSDFCYRMKVTVMKMHLKK